MALCLHHVSTATHARDRMLRTINLLLTLLNDLLRPSPKFKDTPLSVLGQHHVKRKRLILPLASSGDGSPRGAGTEADAGATVTSGEHTLHLQEICCFDGPTESVPAPIYWQGGPTRGKFDLVLSPRAHPHPPRSYLVKSQASVEITPGGSAVLSMMPPDVSSCYPEIYEMALPTLVLASTQDDIDDGTFSVRWQGTAQITCTTTQLSASLTFQGEDIKGSVRHLTKGHRGGTRWKKVALLRCVVPSPVPIQAYRCWSSEFLIIGGSWETEARGMALSPSRTRQPVPSDRFRRRLRPLHPRPPSNRHHLCLRSTWGAPAFLQPSILQP